MPNIIGLVKYFYKLSLKMVKWPEIFVLRLVKY